MDITLQNAIMAACRIQDTNYLQKIIEKHQPDLNFIDEKGNTPMSVSCIYDDMDTIDLLLQHGASHELMGRYELKPRMLLSERNFSAFDDMVSKVS